MLDFCTKSNSARVEAALTEGEHFIGGLQEAWARAPQKWEYSGIMTSNSDALSAPHLTPFPLIPRRVGKCKNSFLPASVLAAVPLPGLSWSQHCGLWLEPNLPLMESGHNGPQC